MIKKLLVLDLDETLVYSNTTPMEGWDFAREIDGFKFWIKKRPGLDLFLQKVVLLYDLAIWSAGGDGYVKSTIKAIAPDIPFVFIWSSNRCTRKYTPFSDHDHPEYERGYYMIKDLKKIRRGNFGLWWNRWNIVVVDDKWETYQRNRGNAIAIGEYNGEKDDQRR